MLKSLSKFAGWMKSQKPGLADAIRKAFQRAKESPHKPKRKKDDAVDN